MPTDFSWIRGVIDPVLISGGILAVFVKFLLEGQIIKIQNKLKKEEKREDFFNKLSIKKIEQLKSFKSEFDLLCDSFKCELNHPVFDSSEEYKPVFVQKAEQHKSTFLNLKEKIFLLYP